MRDTIGVFTRESEEEERERRREIERETVSICFLRARADEGDEER